MDAPDIMARSMSIPHPTGPSKALWQYHSQSDRHSKVSCWAVLFDLIQTSGLLRSHIETGKVAFGVHHPMYDFVNDRPKALDLVVLRPGQEDMSGRVKRRQRRSFADLADEWAVDLSPQQRRTLDALPKVIESPVGAVLVALEAKACMTAHSKSQPRFYDELNSSHQTVHSSSNNALAIGLVTINATTEFISSKRNPQYDPAMRTVVSVHKQPKDGEKAMATVRKLPRRTSTSATGYDGLGVVMLDARNDLSPVKVHTEPPAPTPGDIFNYESMITRMANEYDSAFARI
ncbi:MAG: hypothetical protein ACR2LE_06195 [Nocardioidaceae bacterium]